MLGLCCCVCFSLVVVCGLLTAGASPAVECRLQLCRPRQLRLLGSGTQVQWLWHMGLAASQHLEYSWTRDLTHVLCLGRQILYH